MTKWIARYSGMVLAVLMLAYAIGEGVKKDELSDINLTEYLLIATFSSIWIGYAFGWLNEKLGAILILGGWLGLYSINYIGSGRFPDGFFLVSLVFPGIMYAVYIIRNKM